MARKRKKYTWKDNFKTNDSESPLEPQKRAGICRNCDNGSFTLKMGKDDLKGVLVRVCKLCLEEINPDTGEVIKEGK